MVGYKYRGMVFFERDLETLLRNEIYASLFKDLNDPYESVFEEEITLLLNYFNKKFKISSSDVEKSFKQILDFKIKLGIYSLSLTYSQELMWSHYSSSYKGYCIEYNIEKLKEKYLLLKTLNQQKINYKNKPPSIAFHDIKTPSLLEKLFGTKSLAWEDEKEIRLIFDDSNSKSYHPSALKSICFGSRMEENNRIKLIDSLKDRDVIFYEIFRCNDSFRLERRIVHENKRLIINTIDIKSFKILKELHHPLIENFYVLYKKDKKNELLLNEFFTGFKENFSTKDCNIYLFDSEIVSSLLGKYNLTNEEYVTYANHFIAEYNYQIPNEVSLYPFKDQRYYDCGGK
ncbi:MAG: DUF2971 domain-containing protein [Pelobium sp.]